MAAAAPTKPAITAATSRPVDALIEAIIWLVAAPPKPAIAGATSSAIEAIIWLVAAPLKPTLDIRACVKVYF
jgi:hypothetical protein